VVSSYDPVEGHYPGQPPDLAGRMGEDMENESVFVKAEMINSLAGVRACLLATAASIPEGQRFTPFLGDWSLMDLLAHIAGWDITNLQAVQDIQAGNMPRFYSQYDAEWQTYNATLVDLYRKTDFSEQLELVKNTHKELLRYLQGLPEQEFERDHGLRNGQSKVTIARLLDSEIEDEQTHCMDLEDFRERLAHSKN
jgi:hypothetical protein